MKGGQHINAGIAITIIICLTIIMLTWELKRKVKGGKIMAREKEHYRDNLMRLKEQFPDREFITTKEAAAFCGMCVDTFKKYFKPKRPRISISQLASFIS